ncbi:hypothetical protein [Methylomonas albis]|uniref:Phosphatidate cytidylyltransferase n=1 Tax=Methylomonas albis TaxID=1854563 RepID=A0ABR9D075_9GAMM|nr:hypothetical protein [Methylomonas albis]MBD9356211.1 hypothetical protein [Methylomonas albis]
MKHIITTTILVLAVACYLGGYSGVGNIGFAIGASLETWIWIRILIKRPSAKSDSSSTI